MFLGNIGSKLIAFFMVPLYTFFLSTYEFGIIDIIMTSLQMLLPIITLTIFESVFRFSLDFEIQESNRELKIIFSSALLTVLLGNIAFLLFLPIINLFDFAYLFYVYVILFLQSLQSLLSYFVRGLKKLKIFAINGMLMSIIIAVGNIVLLSHFSMGITGYIITVILANSISIFYLFFMSKIWRFISFSEISFKRIKEMLNYSLPMIPNAFAWWINTAASRFILLTFLGFAANGIFAVATKIPSMLSMLNNIFFQSWKISAVEEYKSEDKEKFYSQIFNLLAQLLFLSSSFILVLIRLITGIVDESFSYFWFYVPVLLLGIIYNSFAGFLGSIYVAAKKTKGLFITTTIGAIVNVSLNLILVPTIGINGAGIANMLGFFLVWILRVKDTSSELPISINYKNMILNHLIFALQMLFFYNINYIKFLTFCQIVFFIMMILINKSFLFNILKVYKTTTLKPKLR